MQFEPGENRFRVLSPSIIGMEYWVTKGDKRQPVRKHMDEPIPVEELGVDKWGNPEQPKYFWAFVVWNYGAKKIQILEITQKTIRNPIKAYVKNPKYGDPKDYDITVTKSGEGKETEYLVVADPPEKVETHIQKARDSVTINLNALYAGEDPFAEPKATIEEQDKKAKESLVDKDDDKIDLDSIPF